MRINKRGFSFIELLVVVLIISMLAAVALPMYIKAVEKARLREALLVKNAIEDSMQRLILEKSRVPAFETYLQTFKELDIQPSGGDWEEEGEDSYYCTKYFCYYAWCSGSECGITMDRRGAGGKAKYTFYTGIVATPEEAFANWGGDESLAKGLRGNTINNIYYCPDDLKICKDIVKMGYNKLY